MVMACVQDVKGASLLIPLTPPCLVVNLKLHQTTSCHMLLVFQVALQLAPHPPSLSRGYVYECVNLKNTISFPLCFCCCDIFILYIFFWISWILLSVIQFNFLLDPTGFFSLWSRNLEGTVESGEGVCREGGLDPPKKPEVQGNANTEIDRHVESNQGCLRFKQKISS